MTRSSRRKMRQLIGRLRWDRQRRRGDFIRPREVPADVWKRACRAHGVQGAMQRAEAGRL